MPRVELGTLDLKRRCRLHSGYTTLGLNVRNNVVERFVPSDLLGHSIRSALFTSF